MKQGAAFSPFAALNSQEQKEQWIVWQAQHDATRPVGSTLPESRPAQAEEQGSRATQLTGMPTTPIHHAQYDAVISRMNAARRRTGSFVDAACRPGHTDAPTPRE